MDRRFPVEPQPGFEFEDVAGALKRLLGAVGDCAADEVVDQRGHGHGRQFA